MGIVERKEREKLEMRESIVSAATKMFLEEGYEKTSIRNIAEAIEYSPATIYLYFKDKDELFFEIQCIGFEKLLKKMSELSVLTNPLERLRKLGHAYVDFAINNPEYYDLMFIMRAPMNALREKKGVEGCWEYGEKTYGLLLQTIQDCIDQKLIRSTNPPLTAMYVWSLVHGMTSLHIRDRFGILEMTDEEIRQVILMALDESIELMKA